ncbi:hypothetical protein [Streptomyces sp. NPDC051561]|uniref:hypothetical protein n=1 Tax=Streptomyces sp. NPDC051561 TaxID=3365658 RepID=UPI00379E8FDC
MTTDEVGHGRRELLRARGAWWLLGLAVFLAVGTAFGRLAARDGGLLLVAQVFHHPIALPMLIVGVLAGAVHLRFQRPPVRSVAAATAVLASAAGLVLVPFRAFSGLGPEVTSVQEAPGRSDRRLVVEEDSISIDPVWRVYVDEGSGTSQRRWRVGRLHGDDPNDGLTEASWADPGTVLVVTGDGRHHLVPLTPDDGRPARTLSRGYWED